MLSADIQALESRLNGVCLRVNLDVLKTYRGEKHDVMWRPQSSSEPSTMVVDRHQTRPNYCKVILDQGRDLSGGAGLSFEADEINPKTGEPVDPADSGESEQEQAIKMIWGDIGGNQQANLKAMEFLTDGVATGLYSVKIAPETISEEPNHVYDIEDLEFIVQQSENIWIIVDPSNVNKHVGYLVYYTLPKDQVPGGTNPAFAELHLRAEDGKSWFVRDGRTDNLGDDPQWIVSLASQPAKYIWPYPFSQIVVGKCLPRPGSPYGRPAFEDLELLENIWFTESSLVKIVKFHSTPKTIVSGPLGKDATLDASGDEMWLFVTEDGTKVQVKNLEMVSDLQAGQAVLKTMVSDLFSENGACDIRLDTLREAGLTAPSSLAIRTAMLAALLKRKALVLYQDAFVSDLNRRLMCMVGLDDWKKRRVSYKTIFVDPLPYSQQEQSQLIGQDIDKGLVSRETGSKTRGYDWTKEKARMDAEKKEAQATALANAKAMADAMPTPVVQPGLPGTEPKGQVPPPKSPMMAPKPSGETLPAQKVQSATDAPVKR